MALQLLLIGFALLFLLNLLIPVVFKTHAPLNFRENFQFYNITPTNRIDPEYVNINEDPFNYYNWKRVGDTRGVDLNCNNVTKCNLLKWIHHEDPSVLFEYVYRYDPSVDINNPLDAPRVFKMLLRNLPQKHRYLSILRKCLPKPVRVA
jgi:hypothetical protein